MSPRSLGPAAALLEEGWSRNRGRGGGASPPRSKGPGASLGRAGQMARAATGARAAVFKAIRHGGCHSRTELARQIAYVGTKSSHVFDAQGAYDGQRVLTPTQVREVTERFARTWDPARPTKLGHTSHLLLSFPIGTKAHAVREVTRGVVEQFFQGDGAQFDYLVAVHEDRAHTHAHVILNRHSPDGEMFYLRSGHHFSYELFREAMVAHGERHGVRLEATRRLDRGLVTYDARSTEVQRARAAGLDASERPRLGRDLEHARRHIALAASTYQGLAGLASSLGFERVSQALQRASLTLARSGVVLPTREIEMADTQGSFDGLLREFGRNVQALEERIATASPPERPRLERGLTDALAQVAALNPLGERSASLREAPSPFGVYSQARIARDVLDRLDDPPVRAAVDAAVRGTGLSASEILARVRVGADRAALEDHWHASDLQAVAASDGGRAPGPDRPRELTGPAKEQALDRLDEVYDRIETVLQNVGVLREARVADEVRERAEEPVTRGLPSAALDIPAPRADTRAGIADETGRTARHPLIAATALRLRDRAAPETAFRDGTQAQVFHAVLERALAPEELRRLRQGDETALARLAGDRLERLALAKAYLESDAATRNSLAHLRVLKQIVSDQVDERRLARGHEEEGPTHG